MSEQEAVTPVEETTTAESAPVEQTTDNTTEEVTPPSADTSVEPEEKNQGVPYDRFSEVNSKANRLQAENDQLKQDMAQTQDQTPNLDPEAQRAVDGRIEAAAEQREYNKFQSKHSAEFKKDPMLEAAIAVEINREIDSQQAAGTRSYIDREEMLTRARVTLDDRVVKAKTEAKKEGVAQGKDVARTKQQLGAVGETGKQEIVDPDELSAADFAKHHNIPRSRY